MPNLKALQERIDAKAAEVISIRSGGVYASHDYYCTTVRELYELRENLSVLVQLKKLQERLEKEDDDSD